MPSFHGRSSVEFTTNIAEADFRYTQGGYYVGGGPVYDSYQGDNDYYQGSGPIYDSCDGYCGNGCLAYGVPFVGALINGVLGGYTPY